VIQQINNNQLDSFVEVEVAIVSSILSLSSAALIFVMSGVNGSERNIMMCCAACGITGVDDVKLKDYSACEYVRYCSVQCQEDHRPQHKRACKKRAAQLRDEILFKQPDSSYLGDCPICCLPHPIDQSKSSLMACCSKFICDGCDYANQIREFDGRSLEDKCPFCRHSPPESQEEVMKNIMKRVEANDPIAMSQMGRERYKEGDYKGAFEYDSKAAELGDVGAHFNVSCLFRDGKGVEKDTEKELHHLEEAAIAGHPDARYNLGCLEGKSGRHERAVKHLIIAANLGHDESLEYLKLIYREGRVSKEDFASALRGHQAAIDAAKSPQREAAEKWRRKMAARV